MHQSILDVMNFGVGVQSGESARLWGILYSQVQKVIPTLPPPPCRPPPFSPFPLALHPPVLTVWAAAVTLHNKG